MTVFVYVNTPSRSATMSTSRCSPTRTRLRNGLSKTTPKVWRSSMRFSNEPDRPQDYLRHVGDRGAFGHLGRFLPRAGWCRLDGL